MEKRKWLWNRKSSDRSPSEGESNGSLSSERYSDEQEGLRESPNDSSQSPEVTSRVDAETEGTIKSLTEKLLAALVNVSAKEELVKQQAKVAEEAVAGWEKAENEVAAVKQQLEVAVQQNLSLEVRASHLEGALRECVRQLRQAKDEATVETNTEWESKRAELEKQILKLQGEVEVARAESSAAIDPDALLIVEALEKQNLSLRQELRSRRKELEVIAIERDLSTQAAESASKLQLESIKKVAKLEAECRRLQSIVRRSSLLSNQKSVVAPPSFYAESVTDSFSESGGRQKSLDIDTHKISSTEANGSKPSCSNSRAMPKNLAACCVEIDMMDDFLEMERLAGLSETENNSFHASESASREVPSEDNAFKAELDFMTRQVSELEKKIGKLEIEKLQLQNALDESTDSLQAAQNRVTEAEIRLEDLQKKLAAVNETQELLEFQLVNMEVEARTMFSNIDSLKAEIEEKEKLSSELASKCQELEKELTRRIWENELEQKKKSNGETKIKQEDLTVAADKLAECQKTIASLGRQLQSLATLEDFLIDTSNIPEFSEGTLASGTGGEITTLISSELNVPKYDLGQLRMSMENYSQLGNGNGDSSSLSLNPSSLSTKPIATAKSWGSFGRMFSRSKSVIELGNSPR